jgi:SET domain-containing protein
LKAVAFISRFRSNVGALVTVDGEPTPKNLALQFWGRDEVKARSKFPNKEEIKKEVVTLVKKEREEAKEEKEKEKKKKDLSESFFSNLLDI